MELERSPLLTDLYELTMLQTYHEHGMEQEAVFEFFLRPSRTRAYFVAAGLEQALTWLETLAFNDNDLAWLHDSGHFTPAFVEQLRAFRFRGEVRALPEGSIFFPGEPMLQVIAPLPQAQLVESRLMNILHFQTLIATKAMRCTEAAQGRQVVDFGLRRAHGGEAGMWAARACYLGGFAATATTLAGAHYGIPVTGTMAHSFILAHGDEAEAFERFARSHPHNVTLLIDTYDVPAGARNVVEVAKRLASDGIEVQAVRIDSGDLAVHARKVRGILDSGGLQSTRILVSGGLDEFAIAAIVADGTPIDGFGVGSKVDTSADEAFLDSAYKLHQLGGQPLAKHSEGKSDLPGVKQIFRTFAADGHMTGDHMGLATERLAGTPMLETVMGDGERLASRWDTGLEAARKRVATDIARLPQEYRRLSEPESFPVQLSETLTSLQNRL